MEFFNIASAEDIFKIVFVIALVVFGLLLLGALIFFVVRYLLLVFEEKHKPRRYSLSYADLVRIFSFEIGCLPCDHVLFEHYRSMMSHLEHIINFQKSSSRDGRLPKIVEKNVESGFYEDILQGRKTFEIRKDKDDIQIGDILILREKAGYKKTCHITCFRVKGVFRDGESYGLKRGYCIISI